MVRQKSARALCALRFVLCIQSECFKSSPGMDYQEGVEWISHYLDDYCLAWPAKHAKVQERFGDIAGFLFRAR